MRDLDFLELCISLEMINPFFDFYKQHLHFIIDYFLNNFTLFFTIFPKNIVIFTICKYNI